MSTECSWPCVVVVVVVAGFYFILFGFVCLFDCCFYRSLLLITVESFCTLDATVRCVWCSFVSMSELHTCATLFWLTPLSPPTASCQTAEAQFYLCGNGHGIWALSIDVEEGDMTSWLDFETGEDLTSMCEWTRRIIHHRLWLTMSYLHFGVHNVRDVVEKLRWDLCWVIQQF